MADLRPALDSRLGWGRLASFYYEFRSEQGRFHHQDPARIAEAIAMKAQLEEMDLNGKRVLDVGCGYGYYAFLALEQGAEVVAVDFAPEMAELTRALAAERGVHLDARVGNACDLSTFDDGSFAAVISGMDLEMRDVTPAFREFARVLQPAGTCLFSVPHPIIHHGKWHHDADGTKLFFGLDEYFHRGPFLAEWHDEAGEPVRFERFRRPLQDYTEALAATGFLIERLLECEPPANPIGAERELADELRRVPMYLVIRAIKRG